MELIFIVHSVYLKGSTDNTKVR